jgi:hypothetical protein
MLRARAGHTAAGRNVWSERRVTEIGGRGREHRRMQEAHEGDVAAALTEHLRIALIRAFGAVEFEVWLGKDGLVRHSAQEIAEASVSALAPLLGDERVEATARSLINDHHLASPRSQSDSW